MHRRLRWYLGLLSLIGLFATAGLGCGDDLAGVSEAEIEVNPTEISFSQVIMGERASRIVTIRNRGNSDLIITNLRIDANTSDLKLGADFPGRIEIEPDGATVVEVVYEPAEVVQAAGSLVIVSNDRDQGQLLVPIITPPLAPVIHVRPEIVDFGTVLEGSETDVTVTLTNRGTAPLIIDDMFLTGSLDFHSEDLDALEYPVELGVWLPDDPSHQETFSFDVTYAPPTPGVDEGIIDIAYNSLGGNDYLIDLVGEAGITALTVQPNPIDFGARAIGLTSSQTITITNNGAVTLEIEEIQFSSETDPSVFVLRDIPEALMQPSSSIALPFNNSLPFRVDFTPPTESTYAGTVIVSYHTLSNPTDTETELVQVFGVGVDNRCPVAVARGFVRDDPQQRRSQQIDWATPTDILILDGGGSFDPDGTIVRHEWSMTRAPDGTTTSLRPLEGFENDDSRRRFFIPLSGRYEFTLRVEDDVGFLDCDDPAVVTVLSLPDEAIHIELSWHNPLDPDENDNQGSDVDLHFSKVGFNWFDDRFDNYYANQEPNWGPELPSLDIDDTDGAGPENVQMDNPVDCQWYAIGAHYFEKQFGTAYTTIRIFIDSEQIAELPNRPLDDTDDFWDVGRLHWPTGEFFAVDVVYENFDSSSARPPAITPEMVESVAGLCN